MPDPVDVAAPNIALGTNPVVTPVVRTGVQVLTPALIIEGLRVFHVVEFEAAQLVWLLTFSTTAVAVVQNLWERSRGRKLIGRTVT